MRTVLTFLGVTFPLSPALTSASPFLFLTFVPLTLTLVPDPAAVPPPPPPPPPSLGVEGVGVDPFLVTFLVTCVFDFDLILVEVFLIRSSSSTW